MKIFPSTTKRAYREGHLVLNHSYSHLMFTNRSDEYIKNELQLTDEQFIQVIGRAPAMMRPPYGKINDQVINIASTRGVKLILWSIDSLDWSAPEKGNMHANVINNLKPGAIILMHSNADKQATVEALPGVIENIQARGYKIVTLDYLLNEEGFMYLPYYI